MYKYEISNQFQRYTHLDLQPEFIPLNKHGFTDLLSINLEDTIRIRKVKNKINLINPNLWEDIKKYTNPYELIYIFNYNMTNNNISSIARIKPLSRSFFKMIEIIYEFLPGLLTDYTKTNIYSLHIAEGPGGFIEATRYLRTLNTNVNGDKAFAITLIDNTCKNVPAWKQSYIFLKNHPEVIISTGIDGTGNIYNINNILSLETLIKSHIAIDANPGIYFITADGGFDYSIDYNYQEQASSKLIFCEIITALKYQCIGGCFVCKFFDINSYISVEMLYLLYLAYEQITIYKPLTSRFANSEKYIICNKFIGTNKTLLHNLFNLLSDWNNNSGTLNKIFNNIPPEFIIHIKNINQKIIDTQIQSINNVINIIKHKHNINIEWKKEQLAIQINNAKEWCKKYKIPYNE